MVAMNIKRLRIIKYSEERAHGKNKEKPLYHLLFFITYVSMEKFQNISVDLKS